MKKLLILFLIVAGAGMVQAQGRVDGQNSFHAQFGFLPTEANNQSLAYMVKGGYSKLFGSKGFMGKADLNFANYEVSYRDNLRLPYQRINIAITPGYSYEGLFPLMINGFVGFYGAYEIVNNNNSTISGTNVRVPEKINSFNTGFVGTAELELSITPWLSAVVDFTQYYDITSKFSKGKYAIYGGFKFNL